MKIFYIVLCGFVFPQNSEDKPQDIQTQDIQSEHVLKQQQDNKQKKFLSQKKILNIILEF